MARIVDDTGLIAIGVDRSVWLDARGLARWSVPSSEHGFMVRSADPSNRFSQYCQSRTRVSVSEPLVRRPPVGGTRSEAEP